MVGAREDIAAVIKRFQDESPDAGYGYDIADMTEAILAIEQNGIRFDRILEIAKTQLRSGRIVEL